jgi:Flp pilus assembly protein TadG
MIKLRMAKTSRRQRGQSLVEFALVLPLMAVMLASILEFGLAFDANLGLEAASRQGARTGASLGNFGTQGVCSGAIGALAEATVDPAIVTAVKTSLSSAGIGMATVKISIFGVDATGVANTGINKYKWDTATSAFVADGTYSWQACGRHDGTFGGGTYDSIAVQITYTYTSRTGLLAIFTGGLPMSTKAIMPIGPPAQLQS